MCSVECLDGHAVLAVIPLAPDPICDCRGDHLSSVPKLLIDVALWSLASTAH